MRASVQKIISATKSERAFNWVSHLVEHHRIQASPGHRAAAQYACEQLQALGIDANVKSYPADPQRWFMSSKGFMEWDCQAAQLWLVSPQEKLLADYAQNKLALCPRSWPADFRDQPLDLVLMEHGPDREAYKGLDARGKLLFIRGHVQDYVDWAIADTGAVGFVTDFLKELPGIRSRADLPDTLNYTSFWWQHSPEEPQVFGFSLTPKVGDWLAEVCRQVAAEHAADPRKPAYPQLRGFVESSFYNGSFEVVEAFLPGESPEEVLIAAHLCHPQPSANDNASGVAAGMEALAAIKELTRAGELPALKRGVRLLLMPEFSGTYPWLEERGAEGRARIVAGLNLDMVAARQSAGNGPLTLSGVPHALPSVAMDAATFALEALRGELALPRNDQSVALFNSTVTGFQDGSDHFIFSDPTIGIPMPMWGQWPDKNYHTSTDDLSVIDPVLLEKSAGFAAAYAYILANLRPADLGELLLVSRENFTKRLAGILSSGTEAGADPDWLYQEYLHTLRHAKDSLLAYEGLFSTADEAALVLPQIERELRLFELLAENYWRRYTEDYAPEFVYRSQQVPELYDYVPQRLIIGPIRKVEDYCIGKPELLAEWQSLAQGLRKELHSAGTFEALLQYNIDGERTLFALAREAMLESHDGSLEYAHAYVQFLMRLGLVELA